MGGDVVGVPYDKVRIGMPVRHRGTPPEPAVGHEGRTGVRVSGSEGQGWAARALALSAELHGSMAR